MKRRRSFLRDTSGANAVEFALLSIPLLLMLMGVFEFGRMYWTQHVLEEIASAGARCIGVLQSECAKNGVYDSANTISYISGRAAVGGIPLTSANITVNNNTTCSGLAGFSSVQVSYTFVTVLPSFLSSLADGHHLSASACYPNQGA